MNQLSDFVGTWRASQGAPYLVHTFTWLVSADGLQGRWIMETADSPDARQTALERPPRRLEVPVVSPWFESGVLYFKRDDGPLVGEFRLEGPDKAVVGAAVDKLPAEFAAPEYRRSFEGHRVRLTRQHEG